MNAKPESTAPERIAQLEAAIVAQEALRPALGDQIVDVAVGAMRAQLAALRPHASDNSLERDVLELQRADLIRRLPAELESTYIFKHALTQDAAYDSLLLAERKSLHGAVARVLESLTAQPTGAQASLIAEHYLRSGAWDQAVALLVVAGDSAARGFAYPEARLHYARALDALSHLPQSDEYRRLKVDTILKLVSVSLRAMGPEESLVCLRDAEAIVRDLGEKRTPTDQDRLRLARIHFWMGHAHMHANRAREATAYMSQVLEAAQALGNEELLAVPASIIGRARALQGHFTAAETLLRQAVGPLANVANWPEWILCQVFLAASQAAQGNVANALASAQAGLGRAQELDYATGIGQCHAAFAVTFAMCRDGDAMRRHSQAGLEVARAAGDRLVMYICGSFLAWAQGRLGAHARADETFAESEQIGRQIGDSLVFGDWFAAAHAELALAAGRLEQARALCQRAVAHASAVNGIFAQGLAERTWAQTLAALDPTQTLEADRHLAESLCLLEAGDARLEAAHTRLVWGTALRARGSSAAAREQLAKALAQFETSGLMRAAEQARATLDDL